MKKRSDYRSSRDTLKSGLVVLKPVSDTASVPSRFSYLPYQYTRTLLTQQAGAHVTNPSLIEEAPRCVAVTLAVAVNALSQQLIGACDAQGRFTEGFYDRLSGDAYLCAAVSERDPELCIIYAKQMVMMLRACGCTANEKSVPAYSHIFDAFWNKVSWDELFPSLPAAATMLHRDRFFLATRLLSQETPFSIEEIACEYFGCDVCTKEETLLFVSFFDFSFLTWLRHFGILRYVDGEGARVRAELTSWGRSFLTENIKR